MIVTRIVRDTWINMNEILGISEEERGAGHTTHQMREAPQGAYFVWCNEKTSYARHLAEELGRTDLQIVSDKWLTSNEAMYSPHRAPIVVDHALSII
jgi:hypothetical protein